MAIFILLGIIIVLFIYMIGLGIYGAIKHDSSVVISIVTINLIIQGLNMAIQILNIVGS